MSGLNVWVCVKAVLDPRAGLHPSADGQSAQQDLPQPVTYLDPLDRSALAEGLRLARETGGSVSVISAGPDGSEAALLPCLAAGAVRAVACEIDPTRSAARTIAAALQGEKFDLILCGEKSLDGGSGSFGPALAAYLGLPQATRAMRLELDPQGGLICERLLERGDRDRLLYVLPVVVSVNSQINQPGYVSVYRQARVSPSRIEYRQPADADGSYHACPVPVEVALPRPRPRKMAAPSSAMTAAERMSFMMSGGKAQKETGGIYEGDAEGAADRIVKFLQEKGLA
jgi:electron transfer flavoprotein beta subunit